MIGMSYVVLWALHESSQMQNCSYFCRYPAKWRLILQKCSYLPPNRPHPSLRRKIDALLHLGVNVRALQLEITAVLHFAASLEAGGTPANNKKAEPLRLRPSLSEQHARHCAPAAPRMLPAFTPRCLRQHRRRPQPSRGTRRGKPSPPSAPAPSASAGTPSPAVPDAPPWE